MALYMPISTVIPLHAVNQLVSNFWRSYLLREKIRRDFFKSFVIGDFIGVSLSVFALKYILSLENLSILVALLIFYTLLKPKKMPTFLVYKKGFLFVGILIGFCGMFLGATGLILGTFFVRNDMTKQEVVATQGAMQSFSHFLKIMGFLLLGFNYTPWLILLLFMTLAALLGTSMGLKILIKLPETWFHYFFNSILFISACKIVWDYSMIHFFS
jgi:uncharacterized membrane protein YfcA